MACGDASSRVYVFATNGKGQVVQHWDLEGMPLPTIDRIALTPVARPDAAGGSVLTLYVGASTGRIHWAPVGRGGKLATCPGAKDVNVKIGEQTVHNLLQAVDEYGTACQPGATAAFLVQCLEYEVNIIALPMHKRVAHISLPDARLTFAAVIAVPSTTSPLPSNILMTCSANGDIAIYSLFQLERVFTAKDALIEFGLDAAVSTDARLLPLSLSSLGNGLFMSITSHSEILRTAILGGMAAPKPSLYDSTKVLGEKPSKGIFKSLFSMDAQVNHEELFGGGLIVRPASSSSSTPFSSPASSSAALPSSSAASSSSASSSSSAGRSQGTAQTAAARGAVSDLQRTLEANMQGFRERGQKINELQEKSEELKNAAMEFKRAAEQLRRQKTWR